MLNVNRNGPNLVLLGSSDNDRRFCARKYQKKKTKKNTKQTQHMALQYTLIYWVTSSNVLKSQCLKTTPNTG